MVKKIIINQWDDHMDVVFPSGLVITRPGDHFLEMARAVRAVANGPDTGAGDFAVPNQKDPDIKVRDEIAEASSEWGFDPRTGMVFALLPGEKERVYGNTWKSLMKKIREFNQ